MKSTKHTLIAAAGSILVGGLLLAGCSATAASPNTGSDSAIVESLASGVVAAEVLATNANSTTVADDEWTIDSGASISLDGSGATAEGTGVSIDGSTVTITGVGTYVLTGQLDGQVIVDTEQDGVVALVLDGVQISSSTSAAIAVLNAQDVAVSLNGGSILSSTAADDSANATLFSDADLTISGDGSLTVDSAANDGITSLDDLVVLSGDIEVTAADDGLRGKDSLTIEGGTVTVDAGGDALKSDNAEQDDRGYVHIAGGTIDLIAGDDAVQAQTDLVITGGDTTLAAADDGLKAEQHLVVAGGSTVVESSYEGLESFYITIEGGALEVNASDDGINATSGTSTTTDVGGIVEADDGAQVTITGGATTIDSEGDGIDSNGSTLITGGTVTAFGSSDDREGALDTNGSLVVDGGTVLAVGTARMAVSPDESSAQGWLSVALDQTFGAGQSVQVLDASGSALAEFTSVKSFQSIVLSAAALVRGSIYTVTVDGQDAGTVTAGVAAAGGMDAGPGAPPARP